MKSIVLKIISVLMWIWFLLSSIVLTPVLVFLWLLTFWWDHNLRILHRFSCFWGAQYIWMNPLWKLKITDRGKFDDNKAYIIVSNHQSLADILVIYSLFKHFRWTSKVENFKTPFVGWVLSFNRSIKVFRNEKDAFERFQNQAVKELKSGNSIMVFPEGTRSKKGDLGRFKDGAFRIALETGSDILPMVLDGTSKAIPKKGWSLTGKQEMILKILDPLPYDNFKDIDYQELNKGIRKIIGDELNLLRQK